MRILSIIALLALSACTDKAFIWYPSGSADYQFSQCLNTKEGCVLPDYSQYSHTNFSRERLLSMALQPGVDPDQIANVNSAIPTVQTYEKH